MDFTEETNDMNQLRRVGIVTLHGNYNYGNRLQLYATQRAFMSLGWSAVELVPKEPRNNIRTLKSTIKRIVGWKGVPGREDVMTPGRRDAFKRFSSNIMAEYVSRMDESLPNRFDLLCVGSDQVWNPVYITNKDDWYFLKFACPEKRLALAASIGVDSLDESQAERIRRGVEGFPSLSVREHRGAELIKEVSGRDAEVLCDPTLTLSAYEWRAVADHRLTPDHPYILAYLLGDQNEEVQAILDMVTNSGRVVTVQLSDYQKECEPDAGPAEFISLVEHAEHVVTDSFHAAVFSCIFQRPLTIVRRQGGLNIFSRIEQLSTSLGIDNKIFGTPMFNFSCSGDYEGVAEAIEEGRERFMSYLKERLDA